MSGILEFISKYGQMLISIGGVAVLIYISVNCSKLNKQKGQIERVLNPKDIKSRINIKNGKMEEQEEEKMPDWDAVRKCEKMFNKECSHYQVYTQLVSLFPLFGILGTVAGLMLQLGEQGIKETALRVALGTTFWGLIWAIVLKFVVAVFPSRIIFDVETMIDNFDKKFQSNVDLGRITED